MTDTLLKEVDEALKWQRIQQFWQHSSRQIITVVSLAIITLIALLFYKQEQLKASQRQSGVLMKALPAQPDLPLNLDALEDAQLSGVYAQLAALLEASAAYESGALEDTAIALENAYSEPNGSEALRDYACFLKSTFAADEAPSCSASDTYRDLLLEFRVMRALRNEDLTKAYGLIAQEQPREPFRIRQLRAYLRSHVAELPGEPSESSQPLPANDVSSTETAAQ